MPKPDVAYRNVSRETFRVIDGLISKFYPVLEEYASRLLWWNGTVNLISRNAAKELVHEHIRHSLFPSFLSEFHQSNIVLDAGSGGGLPGIPLALCHPDKKIILNDISQKKTTVLNHLKRELHIQNVSIVNDPLLRYPINNPEVQCIVSKHAFKIPDILSDISNGSWETLIMLKGEDFSGELSNIPYPVSIDCYPLDNGTKLPFYRGKMMLKIQRV